ncbi:MAG: FlgO family outer membrane protein [Verrucomicrobiota bacterium]|nr:FlgO family outer membrane protein [Verrucomicrobiota bacterium]
MSEEEHPKLRLEIGHVLFIDIVGYSKLLIEEQTRSLHQLNGIVRETAAVRAAERAGHVGLLPTGDGMALVFTSSVEAPVECALEISRAGRVQPCPPIRMGINSGPVHQVEDVNERGNVAGAGINMALRVMDCGDAGHILVSKRVADDLAHYRHWQACLYDLGECEVKHGVRVSLVNLYTDNAGNPALPEKLSAVADAVSRRAKRRVRALLGAAVLLAVIISSALIFVHRYASTGAVSPNEKSIAVLPFANFSDDPTNAYFADGVQDEILTHLARVSDLKVISRTSVMQYKSGAQRNLREIAQQLGVANLLEGSVQRAGNKVRVNAQLIDARKDVHLWAQSYDRDLADVFAIQSEIAKTIADQLRATLSPHEKAALAERPTADVTAFEQYSRAKTLLVTSELSTSQQKSFAEAIELLNSAVARDPSFHAAYCQLVDAHDQLYASGFDRTPARLAAADAALERVMQLRPDAAETHLTRGRHLYYARRDYEGALAELAIAGRSLTNDPLVPATIGYILRRQGKHEEGIASLEKAIALDPRNVFIMTQLALSYQLLRRYPEQAAIMDRAREVAPEDVNFAGTRALIDLFWKADTAPLHQFVERVRTERPAALNDAADYWFFCALAERDWNSAEQALVALGNNAFISDTPVFLTRKFGEGVLARATGDEERARKAFTAARAEQEQILQQQQDYAPAICVLGLADAALGNKDAALAEGRRAMELLPVEKDSITGQRLVVYYALIAALAGEKDEALRYLSVAAPTPGANLIASYGVLKLLPLWDPLRGDPRFDQIVAQFAPK